MSASDVLLAQCNQQVKRIWSEAYQYQQRSFAPAILGITLAGNAVGKTAPKDVQFVVLRVIL